MVIPVGPGSGVEFGSGEVLVLWVGPVDLIAISGWPRMPRMREVARLVEVGAVCST